MTPIALLVVLILIVIFSGVQYFNIINRGLANQINDAANKRKQYDQILSQVQKYNETSTIIKKISAYQVDWEKILLNLANQTPGNLQLTTFKINEQSQNKIEIAGFAGSYRTVMLFKTKLATSNEFNNPVFISASINPDGGGLTFQMIAELANAKFAPTTQSTGTKSEE